MGERPTERVARELVPVLRDDPDHVEEVWSQRRIAEEIGCDQSTVSRRQQRLGVESPSPRGRPRNYASRINPDSDTVEVVDAEVVEEVRWG
jgi:hypothetical protein